MVWGCISAAAVCHLTSCYGTLNSDKYCAITQTHILCTCSALSGSKLDVSARQRSSPHSGSGGLGCRRTGSRSKSDQLNPRHEPHWKSVVDYKRSTSQCKPKSLVEVKAEFQEEELDKMSPQQCERLVLNMLPGLELCYTLRTGKLNIHLMMWWFTCWFLFSFGHILCYLLTLVQTMLRNDLLELQRITLSFFFL